MNISVVLLTFNCEDTVGETIDSALRVTTDVHAVDSFSTDGTLEVLRSRGVNVLQHEFVNYGAQRNWAIANLPLRGDWELHLDADERLSEELVGLLLALAPPPEVAGYYIPRFVHFMGHPIRHGGMYGIWHMRLFRRGKGRCEDRQYDQHFYVDGPAGKLPAPMIDDIRMTLSEWVTRHNRWADAEVRELLAADAGGRIQADWRGDPVQRKRYLRRVYEGAPLFVRPFLLFFYRYILRLGFLDGRVGLVFYVLQTFWFRFLVDAKLFERRLQGARK